MGGHPVDQDRPNRRGHQPRFTFVRSDFVEQGVVRFNVLLVFGVVLLDDPLFGRESAVLRP
jgi:hypothetical protein